MTISATHPWTSVEMSLQMAEAAGAESLWTPDHMLGWFHPDVYHDMSISDMIHDPDAWYDPYLVCARLAPQTDKPFGFIVTDTTRRRAADLLRTVLTLQHLAPGGVIVGLGSGEAENIVPFGYDYTRPVAVLEEFLTEFRCLLDTGRMPTGPGRAGLPRESAAGKPQVWVGGHGPRMLRLTGTYADGWLPGWPMSAQEYGRRLATITDWAGKAGRPVPTAGMAAPFVLGDSRDLILEQLDGEPLAKVIGLFMAADVWKRHGRTHPINPQSRGFIDLVIHELSGDDIRDIAPTIPAEVVEEFLFLGNGDEIAHRIEAYTRHGLEYVVLGNFTGIVGGAVEFGKRLSDATQLTNAVRGM